MIVSNALETSAPIGAQLITLLRTRIVTGALPPGTRLSEKDIAGEYGLSRQPVREAFIKLASDRLVEIRPQRGTYVCRIDIDDVVVSRFVREAVEADIARHAARKADADAIANLHAIVDAQQQKLIEGGPAFMPLDEQFHRGLADAAAQSGAWVHLESIRMHMDRVRHLTATELPIQPLIDQHRAIIHAIARRDPDAAESATRAHLRTVLDDLDSMRQAHPDYFL